MQRPIRIVMFGVLCLIVGVLSGVTNLAQTAVSIFGPSGLEQIMSMMEGMGQPLTGSQRQDFEIQISALSKPVYRVGQGVKSLVSAVMAIALIVAGIGLLGRKAWSLRLTRWWAFYAIPAAAVSVVLSARYVYPELPDLSAATSMAVSVFILLAFWVFPVMLLWQLPTQPVKAYLAQARARQTGSSAVPVSLATPIDTTASDAMPPTTAGYNSSPANTTWRDDPWNDTGSR